MEYEELLICLEEQGYYELCGNEICFSLQDIQVINKIYDNKIKGCGKLLWAPDIYGYTPICGIDGHLCYDCTNSTVEQ